MSVRDLRQWVYVGTQRADPGTGLSFARFDAASGTLTPFALVAADDDPAFFVVTADGRRLYTCNSGTPGGVTAYARDVHDGDLIRRAHHVSEGRGPSQLSLDHRERFVLAANYGGGYVEVIATTADGDLGPQTACVRHEGRSVDPVRQTRPYAHCIVPDSSNRFALAADLGLDRVFVYGLDPQTGALTPRGSAATSPGSGPRHIAWHPGGRWAYVVEELANRVSRFEWDAHSGRLSPCDSVSTLPPAFSGPNTAAEILVHPSGTRLYASNRGHDSVAVFDLATDGTLKPLGCVASGGRTPRYMAFDQAAAWLIVVNVDSETVVPMRLDGQDLPRAHEGVHAPRPYGIAIVAAG